MITLCPNCRTAFQITAEQLSAKAGLVRCGACREVFNGYRGLKLTGTAAPDSVAGPPPHAEATASAVADAPPASALLLPIEPLDASVPAAIAEAEALLEDRPAPAQDLDLDLSGDASPAVWPPSPEAIAPVPRADSHAESAGRASAADTVHDRPASIAPAQSAFAASHGSPPPRSAEPLYRPELHMPATSPAWSVGSALLLAALALQAVYFWRGSIAQQWPAARGYLEAACAGVGCQVPLARELAQLNIESSTLEADPARPGIVVLQTTLQNVAPYMQRYPHLELTLTGVNDDVLGVKVFAPGDYLPSEPNLSRGWPPKQTRAVALHLDVSALPPAGFRLRLLYP